MKFTINDAGLIHSFNDEPAVIFYDGTLEWRENGTLHRGNDLPCLIIPNGTMEWRENGLLHRENDKPARITPTSKEWWIRGKLHRDTDAAYITDKIVEFWIQNTQMSFQQWINHVTLSEEEKTELILLYGDNE